MESDNNNVVATQADNPCLNENGQWNRRGNEVVDQITEQECENIKANTGLAGDEKDNCADLSQMICDLKQEVQYLASERVMTVAANDSSKCDDSDDPTLASMWSRILRFAQAASCIMCAYDPYVATILKMGKYPEILMGSAQEGGYPQWVKPDDLPELESKRPVTSEGVQLAIKQALLGVWHPWEEEPQFTYFAQTLNGADDTQNLTAQTEATPPAEGDTALVANDGTHTSALYTYTGGKWVYNKEFTEADDNLTNFSVTFIQKGYYATKDVYFFDDGTASTWQVMDADLTELEQRLTELESIFQNSVLGAGSDEQYILTTRPTLAEAQSVACTNGKTTLVFVTG